MIDLGSDQLNFSLRNRSFPFQELDELGDVYRIRSSFKQLIKSNNHRDKMGVERGLKKERIAIQDIYEPFPAFLFFVKPPYLIVQASNCEGILQFFNVLLDYRFHYKDSIIRAVMIELSPCGTAPLSGSRVAATC